MMISLENLNPELMKEYYLDTLAEAKDINVIIKVFKILFKVYML